MSTSNHSFENLASEFYIFPLPGKSGMALFPQNQFLFLYFFQFSLQKYLRYISIFSSKLEKC